MKFNEEKCKILHEGCASQRFKSEMADVKLRDGEEEFRSVDETHPETSPPMRNSSKNCKSNTNSFSKLYKMK